ncbi:MAG TPA: hypothetical protein VG148_13275 [Pyrinomonadaceae bacterium]|nr:hypothetical protein [Pyrinomonadaceae bacterium]
MRVFQAGAAVRIKAGPLAGCRATVERVEQEKKLLTVTVKIFGRATPVELTFSEVEPERHRPPSTHLN